MRIFKNVSEYMIALVASHFVVYVLLPIVLALILLFGVKVAHGEEPKRPMTTTASTTASFMPGTSPMLPETKPAMEPQPTTSAKPIEPKKVDLQLKELPPSPTDQPPKFLQTTEGKVFAGAGGVALATGVVTAIVCSLALADHNAFVSSGGTDLATRATAYNLANVCTASAVVTGISGLIAIAAGTRYGVRKKVAELTTRLHASLFSLQEEVKP